MDSHGINYYNLVVRIIAPIRGAVARRDIGNFPGEPLPDLN